MDYFCNPDYGLSEESSTVLSLEDNNLYESSKGTVNEENCHVTGSSNATVSHTISKNNFSNDGPVNEEDNYFSCADFVSGWCNLVRGDYLDAKDTYAEVKPFKYEDIELSQDEIDGWLSPRILASGLTQLWIVPGLNSYALTKLVLQNKGLEDISELLNFPHLLYIDLSYNRINDLSCLKHCNKIVFLNLSHNEISNLDEMVAPIYLTDLNLSHNIIDDMNGLSKCWSLKCLNLATNAIYKIGGIQNLKFLTYLNLSNNKLKEVINLPSEQLEYLILKCNRISKWKQSNTLFKLKHLDLSHNKFSTFSFFKDLYALKVLDVSNNLVSSMGEINNFSELKNLRSVIIYGNDVMDLSEMGLLILYLSPSLLYFNQHLISSHERIYASRLYDKKLVNIAYNNFLVLLAQRHTKGPSILGLDRTYKIYNPGLILLVGPPGSMKKRVIRQIAEKFPTFVKCCNLHTTQEKVGPSMDYLFNFVSKDKFDDLVNSGKTVFHDLRYGKEYALCWSEIKLSGKICMAAVELQDALSMVWQGLRPTLIFTMTKDIDIHRGRLYEEFKDFSFKFYEAFKDNRWMKCTKVKLTAKGEVSDCHLQPNDIYNLLRFVNTGNEQQPDLDFSAYVLGSIDTGKKEKEKSDSIHKRHHFTGDDVKSNYDSNILTPVFDDDSSSSSKSFKSSTNSLTTEPSYSCLPQRFQVCSCDSTDTSDDPTFIEQQSSSDIYTDSLIDYVLSTREEYIELHERYPGLFVRAISTDDFESAVDSIGRIAKDVYYSRLYKKDLTSDPLGYKIKDDPQFKNVVIPEAKYLLSELIEGDSFKLPATESVEPEEYDDYKDFEINCTKEVENNI